MNSKIRNIAIIASLLSNSFRRSGGAAFCSCAQVPTASNTTTAIAQIVFRTLIIRILALAPVVSATRKFPL